MSATAADTDHDLAALGARIAEGGTAGRAAEAAVCRIFAPRVRLYGVRHLRDEERTKDLVQAVLVAVVQALRARKVAELARLDRYVLATARNLARKAHRESSRAETTDPADLDDMPDVDVGLDTRALDVPSLFRCLQELDVRARTILQLSFYREKSAEEIAGLLETTAGNVRVVRHRAIRVLRACLDGAHA